MVVPSDFLVKEVGRREGQVHGARGYSYRDTTYKLVLANRQMGLRNAELRLMETGQEPLAKSRLSWKRVPYVSPVPDRVSLPKGPIRVFLRCPDDGVELTRVITTAVGVKAIISSPRQLTLSPDEGYQGTIDGVVEVETTAVGHPPLRVPVVRYVPAGAMGSPIIPRP